MGQWCADEREWLICEKELFASTVGLRTFAPWLGATCIYEFTDSMVALSAMRSLTPTTEIMQRLVSERLVMAEANGWRLVGERISTSNNLWADLGSRGNVLEVERQAVRLGLRPVRWTPVRVR